MQSCVLRNSGVTVCSLVCVTLWHMSIGPRIIISISFQEVDGTPDAQASAQGNNEGLKNGNSRVEKFHK